MMVKSNGWRRVDGGRAIQNRRVCVERLEDRCLLAALPPDGLVSWYRAENDGQDYVGSNDGALVGDVTFAAGRVGQAFSFDGDGDSVAVPDAASLSPMTALTMEAWVYPTANSGGPGLAGIILNKEQKAANGSGTTQYEMGRRNGEPFAGSTEIPEGNFVFYLGGVTGLPNDSNLWVDARATLPLNTWSHVAVTFDGTTVRSYVNGDVTRQIEVAGSLKITDGDLHIGGRDMDLDHGDWAGRIDEAAIFNRALNGDEIRSIFRVDSRPWQNPQRRWDVTSDGDVAADDVLAIANFINANRPGQVPDDAVNSKPFYDVTGDNSVAADDVIAVINYINAGLNKDGEATINIERSVNGMPADVDELMALIATDGQARKNR